MWLLVLGGTSFLSKQIAHEAVARGHEVACAARGESGRAPEGARLVVIDRDHPGALNALAGERFDAVVDVATGALGWSARPLTSGDFLMEAIIGNLLYPITDYAACRDRSEPSNR